MPEKTEAPKARLEDLDVREVSLVDRPANKRRFLIVKRRDSMPTPGETVERSGPQVQTPATDDVSFFDILGIGEVNESPQEAAAVEPQEAPAAPEAPEQSAADETPPEAPADAPAAEGEPETPPAEESPAEAEEAPAEEPPAEGAEPVAKLETAAELLRRLTGHVAILKDGGELDHDGVAELARDVAAAGGVELPAVEKAEGSPLQIATEAMEGMIGVVAKLQQGDGDPSGQLEAVAKSLASLAPTATPEPEAPAEPEPFELSEFLEVSKADGAEGEGADPIVVIKAGAKMKKARLSQFESAVATLKSILSELKGTPVDASAGNVEKDEGPSMAATVATMLDGIKTSIASRLESVQKAVDGVAERVTRIETTRPTGNGEADPEPVNKTQPMDDSNKDFWSGVL